MQTVAGTDRWDICIVGAGAAGLMTAIWARRTGAGGTRSPPRRLALRLGAKILIAGGGRCNVTNAEVDERDFSGSSPMAIRKVLRRFDAARTVDFFRDLGVTLKREPLGKLFADDDRARTVLDALVREAERCGAVIASPRRGDSIETTAGPFRVGGAWGHVDTTRLVMATGGQSVPKTGSDGAGFRLARGFGHQVTPLFPALVPLLLPRGHFLTDLRGTAVPVALELRSGTGKRLRRVEGALCAAVRAIIDGVDWPCEVQKEYSERNLGCRNRISSGLDWVFQVAEEAIILEDDCLTHPDFFRFCETLLERYREDERVMMVGGTNYLLDKHDIRESFCFSRYFAIWGWATWRRAWAKYDLPMKDWPILRHQNQLDCYYHEPFMRKFVTSMFDKAYQGVVDTGMYSGFIRVCSIMA